MGIYASIRELMDNCLPDEKIGINVIAIPVYSEEDDEILGYTKEYVD